MSRRQNIDGTFLQPRSRDATDHRTGHATAVLIPVVILTSILFLALLGGVGVHAGGAPVMKAAIRVAFWGALAMTLTAGVGALFGAAV